MCILSETWYWFDLTVDATGAPVVVGAVVVVRVRCIYSRGPEGPRGRDKPTPGGTDRRLVNIAFGCTGTMSHFAEKSKNTDGNILVSNSVTYTWGGCGGSGRCGASCRIIQLLLDLRPATMQPFVDYCNVVHDFLSFAFMSYVTLCVSTFSF